MLVTALLMAAALAGSGQDGVVATAPATSVDLQAVVRPEAPSVVGAAQAAAPHGLTTDQQIDRWLSDRDPETVPYADGAPRMADDRQMHSEFNVTVGTDGYRDYGVAVSLPVGDTGRIDLSYRQVENGYPYYGYGAGYGYGDPAYYDAGHAFPGRERPGQAWEFESRLMRPGGPPRPVLGTLPRVESRE